MQNSTASVVEHCRSVLGVHLENPLVRFWPEIPTVRESQVADVRRSSAPTVWAEMRGRAGRRPGDGDERQFSEQAAAGDFHVGGAAVRIAQRPERVRAVSVV